MPDTVPPLPPPAPPAPADEIPRFRFVEKKVDTTWKEEVRKERAAVAAGPAPQPAATPGRPGAPAPKGAPPSAAPGAAGAPGAQASKLFLNFLAQLVQQGLMQLGQMENPYTNQREVDLEGARFTIELLAVLQQKTKGNLAEQESRMLAESVRELQLQYVEIAQEVARQVKEQALKQGKGGAPPARGR